MKGRRGIGNYDTFCQCFEKEGDFNNNYAISSKLGSKSEMNDEKVQKKVKPNGTLISPANK